MFTDRRWWRVSSAVMLSILGGVGFADAKPPEVPTGYKLVWSDEFRQKIGSAPDARFWTREVGAHGWGNRELQEYVDDTEHAQVVEDKGAGDGRALQILVTNDGPGKIRSARLKTAGKISFQYGYIEARLRLPFGQGIWPAFWMLGSDISTPGIGWPECGEIDIMENIGKRDWWGRVESSLHGPGYSGGNALHDSMTLPENQFLKDSYHTFAVHWEKDKIQFLVDGKVFETRTPADIPNRKWVFNHPFFILVNVAVGGNFSGNPDATTTYPQKYLVDYIRVYQKPGTEATVLREKNTANAGAGINKITIHGED